MLAHLKRNGPTTIKQLIDHLGLAETAVRHHLHLLERQGFVQQGGPVDSDGVGRPAKTYQLTDTAEGLFPKQYRQLLELVLTTANAHGELPALMTHLTEHLVHELTPKLHGLNGEDRLKAAVHHLDLSGPLVDLERTPGGWEVHAYNCPYLAVGRKFEAVCDLAPRVLTLATGLPAERPACQRDGERACRLTIGRSGG